MAKPLVAVFSDPCSLGLYLIETLLSKNCQVIVYTTEKNFWLERTKHIANKNNFEIADERTFVRDIGISYAVFCCGFIDKSSALKKFKSTYSLQVFRSIKSLVIFPAEAFESRENASLPLNSNLAVIYTGDLLSPRIDTRSNLSINRIIGEIVGERTMTIGVGEVFYPIFASDAAKQISKWVFSFGPYGKETFLLGNQVSGAVLWREVGKLLPGVNLYYDKKLETWTLPRGYNREVLPTHLGFCLKETLKGLPQGHEKASTIIMPVKIPSRHLKIILFSTTIFLLFPFICLLISGGLLFASYKTKTPVPFAKIPASIGKMESAIFKNIPIIGAPYKESYFMLGVLEKASDLSINAMSVVEDSEELLTKILGDEIYDPGNLTKDLEVNLEYIQRIISFVQTETVSSASQGVITASFLQAKVDLERLKRLSSQGVKIVANLSRLLGKEGRKTYLVLFQNNMEIRPTGGFIGSFGLVTFEAGRMTDFSVSDVYSADGQLRGHIEPPKPIKDYLGEANWYLRDSNWDPDFPTSARRAEWFLDKEIDRQVEGVVAIDLNPVKEILKYTGPIYLSDYNMDITSENIYEKTQSEVQDNFFPGTHKKASFLTALSRNLVTGFVGLDSSQKIGILRTFIDALEKRHIQAFLHDEAVQSAISSLGWSGEVTPRNCGENCYSDMVGLIEANVGVNKANYFITRDQKLVVDIDGDRITRELTINFRNSANPGLGLPAQYKSYVRVLVPQDSEVEGDFEISEGKGIKEIGFFMEVTAGQEGQVKVSWSSKAGNKENYGLYIRKQAGTPEEDKISVVINGDLIYNSNFTRDTWLQKH